MLAENLCQHNPIDDIECLFCHNKQSLERRSENEIAVEIAGKWDNMLLFFAWEESMKCLHISCLINIEAKDIKPADMFELLALMNEDMWVGCFSYWEEMKMPIFKHSLFIDDSEFNINTKLSQILNVAITECERAYPIFHAVLKQKIPPRRALMPLIMM